MNTGPRDDKRTTRRAANSAGDPVHGIDRRFRAPLPDSLARQVPDGAAILVSMETDMRRDGRFAPAYVVVTEDEVIGLAEGEPAVRMPFTQVSGATADELFGAGRLMLQPGDAKTNGDGDGDGAGEGAGARCIALYSRNLVPEFAATTRIIDDIANGHEWVYPELEGSAFSEESGVPLPERGASSPLDVPRWKIVRRMNAFLGPYHGKAIALIVLITISVIAQMSVPMITKFIMDGMPDPDAPDAAPQLATGDDLLFLVGLMAFAFVVIFVTRSFGNILKSWISGRIIADMRARLHDQMQRLRMAYHNKHESGELVGRVMNDSAELQHFLVDGLPFLFINVLSFFGIGIALVWLNPLLALCVFFPVPLLLFGGAWFWKRLVPLFHKRGNRTGVLHSVLGESIRGVKSVKALGQEDRRHRRFVAGNESLFGVSFHVDRTFISFFEVMALLMGLGGVAVWYFGSRAILDDDVSFTKGDLIAYIGYMHLFYGPLQWFTAVVNWMTHAFASAERILQVLDKDPEPYDAQDAIELRSVEGAIGLHDVRFSYNRGKEVIKGISLEIAPGQMIGLVGKSGAGKSTIINLICRFYDVDSGAVTVDGHDLRSLKLSAWRRNIGIVMQEPFLFSATIAENIAYGAPGATFQDIVRAARAAKAHEFILDKEEGYDTMLGEGGSDLSGGEKQRVAIARAILNDPPVLILDEATSAVDSETEKAIQEAIQSLVKGRTTIAIAHRLATLRHADRLVVIGDGKILEQGSHDELLADEDGHFAKLVRLQDDNNRIQKEQSAYAL